MNVVTKEDLRGYLSIKTVPKVFASKPEFAGKPVTHMLMVCDTFSWEDYPVYIAEGESITETIKQYSENMQKVMEVYSYRRDLESQLNEHRAWHLD